LSRDIDRTVISTWLLPRMESEKTRSYLELGYEVLLDAFLGLR